MVLDGLREEPQHFRAMPSRRHSRGAQLQLIEGVSGGRQTAAGGLTDEVGKGSPGQSGLT